MRPFRDEAVGLREELRVVHQAVDGDGDAAVSRDRHASHRCCPQGPAFDPVMHTHTRTRTHTHTHICECSTH